MQEAKSASALSHPNIIHVFDIDQADGVDYNAMEYVEGKTLDQLIPRKGLRLNEALKYSVQIADALSAGHEAGIVHRDLKLAKDGTFRLPLFYSFGFAHPRSLGGRSQFRLPTTSDCHLRPVCWLRLEDSANCTLFMCRRGVRHAHESLFSHGAGA